MVTEDAVTRGTSPMEAVEVVRALGATPVLVLAVVDRGGTCAAMAAARRRRLHPLVTAPDLGFPYEKDAEPLAAPWRRVRARAAPSARFAPAGRVDQPDRP